MATVATAGLLSGCVVFQGTPTVKQVGKKPKVQVAFKLCRSNTSKGSACPDEGNAGAGPPVGVWYLLLGFRVPKGTKAPERIRPVSTNGEGGGRIVRDLAYTAQLNQKAPRPQGFRYVGYSSSRYNPSEPPATGRFKVRMTVPKRVVGKRFKVRPVVGAVEATAEGDPPPQVDCGEDPFVRQGSYGDGYTICIDSPAPDAFQNIKVKVKR